MQVAITGSESILGQTLVQAVLAQGRLVRADDTSTELVRVLGVDRESRGGLVTDDRLEYALGDYTQHRFLARALGAHVDCVFHLDALLAGFATANDPDGLDHFLANGLDTTRALLDACGELRTPPRVIFAGCTTRGGTGPSTAAEAGVQACEQLLSIGHHCGILRLSRVGVPDALTPPTPDQIARWVQALVQAAANPWGDTRVVPG
jgi:nucleoside-diphosphate-sugar epimerase